MRNLIALAALTIGAASAQAVVPNLTAAELSAHKVEKLIILKKIDSAFQTQFRGLEVINLQGGGQGKPTFKVILSQEADAGRSANKVELTLDQAGKTLGLPQVVAGTSAAKPTVWSGKDPLTLTELALHHIEHLAGAGDKKISSFVAPLKAVRLIQSGQNAQFEIIGNGLKGRLIMNLDAQGNLINAQVVE